MTTLNNTYFGFTNNLKPMQKAKFEATLDKYIRYEGKAMTEKVYALNKLIEGFTPSYEENYTYYSKRIDGMTKPKTLYTLENNGVYSEVSKTVYSFVLFLIENDINTIEKAEQYATEEAETMAKVKAEENRIRLEKEAEEKAKRDKLDQEMKERQLIKIKQWKENGLNLMTDSINKVVIDCINEQLKEIEASENDKQEFTSRTIESFTVDFGNEGFTSHNASYLYFDCTNNDNLNNKIYKAIYSQIFNINETDPKTTVTAKVKAFYNGKEYKGTKLVELETFYIHNAKTKQFEARQGEKKTFEGFVCFIDKNENGMYKVTEAKTGMTVSGTYKTKSEAIQKTKEAIQRNKEKLDGIIKSQIERVGLSPLYAEIAS